MSMLFKRIKDWAVSITSFRTGDVIAVDGPNGTAKMSKDDLLKETAQNALAGNLASAFDPARNYIADEKCVYEGDLYKFLHNHFGLWDENDVERVDIATTIASKTNKPSFSDFSITDGAGHSVLEVKDGHLKTKNFDSRDPKKTLKILHIGNSFGYDSMSYVPYILKSVGIDVLVGISYKGGNYIDQMNSEYTLGDNTYEFSISGDKWNRVTRQSIQDAVKSKDWDVIIIQQKSDLAANVASYSNLSSLIDKILADAKPGVSLALSIPASYRGYNNEAEILATSEEIFGSYPFQTCFCYGTAIFDSQNGLLLPYDKGWSSDGIHLNEGLPCYVAACAMAETILESFYNDGRSVLGNSVRPTQAWIESVNVQNPQGTSVGVTDANCIEAQKIAIKANKFKFQIKE